MKKNPSFKPQGGERRHMKNTFLMLSFNIHKPGFAKVHHILQHKPSSTLHGVKNVLRKMIDCGKIGYS